MTDNIFSVFQDERFMDLTIYQYGYEQCEPLYHYGPHIRNNYLFHYVISGKGVLQACDEKLKYKEYPISAGNGFLIEPGYVNTYCADKDEPWEYVWLEFGGMCAKECMELAGISQKNPVYKLTDVQEGGKKILQEMFAIVENENALSLELIGHLYLFMNALILYSAARKKRQGGKLSEFYIREAVVYIERNYAKNITVEDIAQVCRLDRSYFGKLFKKVMGQSPQEFLIRYRMAKAADALKTGNDLIGEIGASVGYANPLHFSRAFKNVYGLSPSMYRQKYKIVEK